MDGFLYEQLNNAWKRTCKIIFGEEVGELKEFEEWLLDFSEPFLSKVKGKEGEVYFSSPIPKHANVSGFNSIKFNDKEKQLTINEIKDIDSIIQALREKGIITYAGNIILGNSRFVEKSTNITDSIYVYKSSDVIQSSKYVAYSSRIRASTNVFGNYMVGEVNFAVRSSISYKSSRLFESYFTTYSSDIYFSHYVEGCVEALFSFYVKGKNYVIGNLELKKDKYLKIKEKLLEEIREELEKKKLKSLFSLFRGESSKIKGSLLKPSKPPEILEKTFSDVTKTLFGKKLENIESYLPWLEEHLPTKLIEVKGKKGRRSLPYFTEAIYKEMPLELAVDKATYENVERKLNEKDIEELTKAKRLLESIVEVLLKKEVARFVIEIKERCTGVVSQTPLCHLAGNVYRVMHAYSLKECACSYYPRNSHGIFGCSYVVKSNFSIHVYHSTNINRAFEVDSSNNSFDVYFSHNVENVRECFFCFNVKNLSFAVGNLSLDKDKYLKIKEKLLEEIREELEKKKRFRWNIYNLGG